MNLTYNPFFKGASQMKNDTTPIALQIQFRHMPKSEPIVELIKQQADQLGRFKLQSAYCTVTIDADHRWNKGGRFNVSIRLNVPGERLYLALSQAESTSDDVIYIAVRTAFREIEHQLKKQRSRKTCRATPALAF
jgi:ribosome-associated translation inhibitor RaiA